MSVRPHEAPEHGPAMVRLDDPAAADASLTGAKAANLARARAAGLPVLDGAVLTTAWSMADRSSAFAAWRAVSHDGGTPVVVRSSSTGEDGGTSSMAGVFDSVLDVRDEAGFDAAIDTVLGSAAAAATAGLADAQMAVLVQPMLQPTWGGVLFTADPVTGRRDRLVVGASPTGPAALVSGETDGWTAVLSRTGRVLEVRSGAELRPPKALLRDLTRLARRVVATFGGPQDIEWSLAADGKVRLLQARPITALAPRSGPVFGPGPVAESFPDPLSRLEQDLWLAPMRDGLREALRLTGTTAVRALVRSPLVIAVDGQAAVDLDALGFEDPGGRPVLHRLDPRPPARRLRAAWRVGRLRLAFPELADDLVRRVDADLSAVPALGELSNAELLAVLRNGRRSLTSLHGHEALAGILIPDVDGATVTAASMALSLLAQARNEGLSTDELVEREPVVLALVPPRIGPVPELSGLVGPGAPTAGRGAVPPDTDPDRAAVAREALRLRIRWLQELLARSAWELGRRLMHWGLLSTQADVRVLSLDEVHAAVQQRALPTDLAQRASPSGRVLPGRFRLAEDGTPVAAPHRRRRRGAHTTPGHTGIGAGGGAGQGLVHVGVSGTEPPAGSVLVVTHLDPRLAGVIPRLAGLVAETGNPLSHLAILAREHDVPTVVGLAGATDRFPTGTHVAVDGHAGTVRPVEPDVIDLTDTSPAAPDGLLGIGVEP